MKTLTICLLVGCGLIGIPLVLAAANDEQATGEEYQLPEYKVEDIAALPKPIHQVIPIFQRGLVGTIIDIRLEVNKQGEVSSVHTATPLFALGIINEKERDFASQMIHYVSSWMFEPALDANKQPVAVEVSMPVKVVDGVDLQKTYASLALQKLELIRKIN